MAANKYATTAGTLLYFDTLGAADPATALAGIDSLGGLPQMEADEFETTRVDQTDGGAPAAHDWFKQFAPDAIDPGTLELKLGLDESNLETLYGLVRQFKTFKIVFSSGGKLVFDGFIKAVGPEAQGGDEMLIDVSIRVSGKPVFTKFV